MDELKSHLDSFKEGYRLELGRKQRQRSRIKEQQEKGKDQVMKERNQSKLRSRAKLVAERGSSQIRKEENLRKAKSRKKLLVERGPAQIRREGQE